MKNRRKLRSLLSWILSLAMLLGTLGGDRIPALAGDDVPVPAAEALDGDGENTFSCSVSRVAVSINQESAEKLYTTLMFGNKEGFLSDFDEEYPGRFRLNVNPPFVPEIIGGSLATEDDFGEDDINITFFNEDDVELTHEVDPCEIAYAEICRCQESDITEDEYILNVGKLDENDDIYTTLNFTFYNVIVWSINASGEDVGFWQGETLVKRIDDTYVKYGKELGTAISAFPSAHNNDKSVLYWREMNGVKPEEELQTITLDSIINEDMVVGPVWGDAPEPPVHTHRYHASTSGNVTGQVEWNWSGNDDDGYTAKVDLYCISENCPSENHAKVTIPADITSEVETISGDNLCYSIRTVYTATAKYEGNEYTEYTDTKESLKEVEHIYHESTSENIPGQVEWTWSGNDDDGYTAKVDLYCISENCMAADHGKVTVSADVTSTVKTVSVDNADSRICTVYTATAEYDGNEYTNTKQTLKDEVHYYHESTSGNIPGQVSWNWIGSDDDGYTAKVDLYCISENCMDSDHGKVTVSADVTVSGDSATCSKNGIIVWTARAEYDGNVYTDVKQSEVPATGHSYSLIVEWNDDHKTAKKADLICSKCNEEEEGHSVSVDVLTELTYDLKENNGKIISNQAIYKAGTEEEIKSEVWYAVIWAKESVAWTASYADDETTAKAVFTLKDSPSANKVTVSADKIEIVSVNDAQKTFKATVNYEGFDFEDTYEAASHEHKWGKPEWTWTGVTSENAAAKADFTCNVVKTPHTATVTATVTKDEKKSNDRRVVWLGTVTGPDGKTYTDYHTYDIKTGTDKPGTGGQDIQDGGFTLEGLEEEYPYTGAPIKPAFDVVDNATGTKLANGTDYSVTFSNNTKVGVATIKVKGKGNYNKSNAEAAFKIVDPKAGMDEADLADLKGAKITAVSPKAFDYNGEAQYPETITLKLKGGSEVTYTGTDGENYVDADGNVLPAAISFSGNVNKGTATVLLSGKNNAKDKATTVKKTFKINAVDLKAATTEDLIVTVEEKTVAWEVKGAQPAVKVEYKGRELLEGQDYKVSYKNNKKVGTATVTIAGKGNYAKTRKDAASFTIEAFDLTGADIIATTAAAGVNVTKVKVTVLDKAGNVIPAGKLAVTVEGAAGAKLAAGETVTVKASAKGAELKESCSEEVTVQAGDLSKAKIKVNVKKTYTGEAIELTDDDMKLVTVTVAGATLTYGEDFEIAGYSNNIKKGSMVVTIVGKGEKYSGSKTFKVKIEPKPIGVGK